MARCYSPSRESYPRYGGLGVLVCEEWHHFSGFFASIGVRPSGKTLDRKENSKGYNPENCRWATPKEQALNRGRSIRVVLAGEVVSLPDAATKLGVSYWRLYREIKSGNSKLELSK